jgi:glycogen operon protein
VFRRRRWFEGEPIAGGPKDIAWFRPDGSEMKHEDWQTDFAKSLGVFLNGEADLGRRSGGEPIRGASFYLIFNAHHEALAFRLPGEAYGAGWLREVDTAAIEPLPAGAPEPPAAEIEVAPRSLVLLRRIENPPPPLP